MIRLEKAGMSSAVNWTFIIEIGGEDNAVVSEIPEVKKILEKIRNEISAQSDTWYIPEAKI